MHPLIRYFSTQSERHSSAVDKTYTNFRQCDTDPSHCSMVCRCGKIRDVTIRSIDLNRLMDDIFRQCYRDYKNLSPQAGREVQCIIYCLDRILRIRRLYLSSNWTYRVEPGYYGEEFWGCLIQESVRKPLISDLERLINRSPADQIRWVLELEYGYLLPILHDCTFWWHRVPREMIKFGCPHHYTRVSTENTDHYAKYQLPRCICRHESDGTYWIVDGHHRFSATPPDSTTVLICVIVSPSSQPHIDSSTVQEVQEVQDINPVTSVTATS
jgi:hypothetical protein